jgi:hypothetical protein
VKNGVPKFLARRQILSDRAPGGFAKKKNREGRGCNRDQGLVAKKSVCKRSRKTM